MERPRCEFFSQFNLIARANHWSDETKTVALASCLRGKSRSILETVQDLENLEFAELKLKLELHFGERPSFQDYYSQFTYRKQRYGKEITSLNVAIERTKAIKIIQEDFKKGDRL